MHNWTVLWIVKCEKVLTYRCAIHNSDFTGASWPLIHDWLFVHQLVRANNKENIKGLYNWSFMKEYTGDHWIIFTKAQKAFPCHEFIISWNYQLHYCPFLPCALRTYDTRND